MPLFDYRCSACSEHVEVLQKHNDPAPSCSKCGAEMKRDEVPQATGFVLNGGGWYRDGYASAPKADKK